MRDRVPASDGEALALLTPDEMSRADAFAVASGRSTEALMLAAGEAVAAAIMARWAPRKTLGLCGPGNNGGGGFGGARALEDAGWPVRGGLLRGPSKPQSAAAPHSQRWEGGHGPRSPAVIA